ncbi:MAG: hypothetical protein ACKVWV_03600 [Planctomycetota bacterium]
MQHASLSNLVPPAPGAVLVLERWNSWVRVFDPQEGAARWIDLGDIAFEAVSDDGVATSDSSAR